MNMLNKTVGFILNPLFLGMAIIAFGMVLAICRKRRMTIWCMMAAVAWFWFWSMPIAGNWLAMPLEKDFPIQLAGDMPTADAIALMGGGVGGSTNYPYAMLRDGADRAWHAARLWRAGKAPIIIPSNVGAELADIRLLTDLGVPKDAVELETKAENTEENAKFVKEILAAKNTKAAKVLLVTSACHMKRSLYMFRKYAPEIECIPAAHLITRAMSYINRNATKGIAVNDVVTFLGVSRRLADLRFQQFAGETINAAIVRVRLDAVKKLLATTTRPIHTISEACGYSDLAYLKKLFKKRFGVTMREWRKRN